MRAAAALVYRACVIRREGSTGGRSSPRSSQTRNARLCLPCLNVFIDRLDIYALTWLHQFLGRSKIFDALATAGLNDHVLKLGPFVFVICWLWFDAHPSREQRREQIIRALLTAVAALVLGRVLALGLPFRLRPAFRLDLDLAYPAYGAMRTWSAFPSDHAVVAFALAVALGRLSPLVGIWSFAHAAVIICFPRVYFGLHHPSDVIGGALIGITLAMVVACMPLRRAGPTVLMRVEQTRPALFYGVGFFFLYEVMTMFDGLRSIAIAVFGMLRNIDA
jgi:membrane-associated phospholipid phosphatase